MTEPGNKHAKVVQLSAHSERTMRHEVAIRHPMGPVTLDVSFTIAAPWTVLFGPSGAGKTTILRMIAGLECPKSGRIVSHVHFPPLEERHFVLTDTSRNLFVPPHRRVVRMVAQRPALFPHKTVLGNLLYRMLRSGRDAEERHASERRLENILALCRVGHLRDKVPAELSGGERQRVALARTLAAGLGRLLILDEPFTGLDAKLRADLMNDLRDLAAERRTPVLMVTHDIGDAFASQAHIIRLHEGNIASQGPAAEVLAEERERLTAILG